MEAKQSEIQNRLIESNLGPLWDILGRYARGKARLILYLDHRSNPVKVSELCQAFDVSMPRVSSMIRSLCFERLIRRSKGREDSRSTYVALTPKGKAKAEEISAKSASILQGIVEKAGMDTVERFLEDASTLSRAAEETFKEDSTCSD